MHRDFHNLAALAPHLKRPPDQAAIASFFASDRIISAAFSAIITAGEWVYLDRFESDWPLQIRLSVGSRVPLHCTASGKLFLSLSPPVMRQALLQSYPLRRYTARTITDQAELEAELDKISQTEVGTDNEEFIDSMAAAAVPVLDRRGRICATVAVHGPTGRLPLSRAIALAPALKQAADQIAETFL